LTRITIGANIQAEFAEYLMLIFHDYADYQTGFKERHRMQIDM